MLHWQAFMGEIHLEITSADCASVLNALASSGVSLQNVTYCNDLIIQLSIFRSDYQKIRRLCNSQGVSVKILRKTGLYWIGKAFLKRPALLCSLMFFLILATFLPTRVLFIFVEGNSTIPTNLILEAADECGIRFGAVRRDIRSESMKNALLQRIPQLQWAGINTSGCTAVISVREKTMSEFQQDENMQVSSIVALRDGIIQNCTVFQGNPLCSVGQAVKAGQMLVSGYSDYGIVTKATRASAEIKALTFREITAVSPKASVERGNLRHAIGKFSIRIGKKLINLYKDSGNLDTTCAKIYSEEYVHLPGGFQLPVAVIKETLLYYGEDSQVETVIDSEDWLAASAQAHLESIMIAGEVISAQTQITTDADAYYLEGKYACMEMIGQIKYEQTIVEDGVND